MTPGERLADLGYAAGWRTVRALPERTATRIFDLGGALAARRIGPDAPLRRNLARVLGVTGPRAVPETLVAASLRSYARYWKEAFRLPAMDLAAVARSVNSSVRGQDILEAALAQGRGVILALPHSGNWDVAGTWLVQTHGGFATVAERLRPDSLYDRFVAYREALGFHILPLTGGSPPFPELARRLADGEVVCLLGERDLRARGVPVEFFGADTRMPAGPARLAMDTGAPLLPVHCWFDGDGWGFSVDEPIDVSGGLGPAVQSLARAFESSIARHPADWHMLQPLWLADLTDEHRRHIAAAADAGVPSSEEVP